MLAVVAARYGYVFGTDVVVVLEETDDMKRRVRMAALEVYAIDHRREE